MKKICAILFTVMLTVSLSAQTDAGRFYVALGNAYAPVNANTIGLFASSNGISIGSEWTTGITIDGDDDDDLGNDYWESNQKDRTSNFAITGRCGYFIVDGLLAGLGIEYGSYNHTTYAEYDQDFDGYDDEFTTEQKANSLAFSPFIKYYFSLGQNALFVSSSYTFGTVNSSYEEEIESTSSGTYDYESEDNPIRTSRWEFGTGMSFFLTESVAFEPSVNYALNSYTQEQEIYVGTTTSGTPIYDDQDRRVRTNAFYFKIAASMYF